MGYQPTSKDYLKSSSNDQDASSNRILMGQLNYDGLIYHNEDDKQFDDQNIDQDMQDKIKEKDLNDMFKDKREDK